MLLLFKMWRLSELLVSATEIMIVILDRGRERHSDFLSQNTGGAVPDPLHVGPPGNGL